MSHVASFTSYHFLCFTAVYLINLWVVVMMVVAVHGVVWVMLMMVMLVVMKAALGAERLWVGS